MLVNSYIEVLKQNNKFTKMHVILVSTFSCFATSLAGEPETSIQRLEN